MNIGRISFDPSYNRAFIGFDRLFDELEKVSMKELGGTNYPPNNIRKDINDDNKYIIEIAVAGFDENEIDISVENNVLTIKGMKLNKDENTYIYRGIGHRNFTKVFRLSDTVVVNSADFLNGILRIYLENVIPENKKPRKILIGSVNSDQKLLQE